MSETTHKPRVFVFINGGGGQMLNAVALSEDGVCLGRHVCSTPGFVEHDMGVNGPTWSAAESNLAKYAEHYPDGYELVSLAYLTNAEMNEHKGFQATLAIANAKVKAKAEANV